MAKKYNAVLSEYRRKFFDKYNNELKEILNIYENCRIDAYNKLKTDTKNKIIYQIIIPAVIVPCGFVVAFKVPAAILIIPVIVIVAAFMVVGYNLLDLIPRIFRENKAFQQLLKKNLVNTTLNVFEGNIERFVPAVIPKEDIPDSQLFAGISSKIEFDANFVGSYKGVDFVVSEAVLYSQVLEISTFKGVLIKFKCNKNIKNRTVVISKKDKFIHIARYLILTGLMISVIIVIIMDWQHMSGSKIMGNLIAFCLYVILEFCHMFSSYRKSEKLVPMKLEDVAFDKKYLAYSSDQIEGRYLVTTAFMERFQNLKTAFHSNDIKCSFYDDTLMIAISTNKNLFEVGDLFHPLNTPKYIEEYFNQISSILEMVDYFKLDEKIGL